jgi:hypothetical protein
MRLDADVRRELAALRACASRVVDAIAKGDARVRTDPALVEAGVRLDAAANALAWVLDEKAQWVVELPVKQAQEASPC